MQDGLDPTPGINNQFATIPDVSVDAIANRVAPRQVASGVQRGTQIIMNTDGSYITLGLIPNSNNQFGIAFFTASGTLVSKNTATTQYFYDETTGKNIIQIGKLPDNTYGYVVATTGNDVQDAYS